MLAFNPSNLGGRGRGKDRGRKMSEFQDSEGHKETPALAMADEKPKEGVKTENNDHINLKDRMVLWCSVRLRGIHHLVN